MGRYVFHFLVLVGVTLGTSLLLWYASTIRKLYPFPGVAVEPQDQYIFEGFNNETGTEDGSYIVPNIIHFLRFKEGNFSFVDAVCVLSAFKNHRPDKIMFHTDLDMFVGPYWEKIRNTPGIVYEIRKIPLPERIFGQKFSEGWHVWHAADVTRIRILMEHGGIYLDNDIYVVQNLNRFRKFEMAIGWDDRECIGNQILVANRSARFLRLWLESYKEYYPDRWYYNAGCRPAEELLYKTPEIVHRVKLLFGIQMLIHNLYKTTWKNWRRQYSVHLLMRHRSYLDKEHLDKWPVFDENNIKDYPMTFGEMAREAYGISEHQTT